MFFTLEGFDTRRVVGGLAQICREACLPGSLGKFANKDDSPGGGAVSFDDGGGEIRSSALDGNIGDPFSGNFDVPPAEMGLGDVPY